MAYKNFVVFDIDGTLMNCDHRVHLAKAREWDSFHEGMTDDVPYLDMCKLAQKLDAAGCVILCVTGRNERYRTNTHRQLLENEVPCETLIMRPNDDFTRDGELKVRLIEEYFSAFDESFGGATLKQQILDSVLIVLEDRDYCVTALRDYGFTVLQPREGTY
jgi:FMN phosphatase YigB (HAD superfamily)